MADFDDILCAVGDFGLFQKLLLMALCYPHIMLAFQMYSLLFVHTGNSYHCNTDWILRDNASLTAGEQLNLTIPRKEDGSLDECCMFTPTDWDIDDIREHGLNGTTGCVNGWVYDTSVFQTSIVSEFDLVCDEAFLLGVGQAVYMAGFLCGIVMFGALADIFGRKRTTRMTLLLMAAFTTAVAVAPDFYSYAVLQFAASTSYGGFAVSALGLGMEWLGVTKRSLSSCFANMMLGVGQCIMAGLAYFIRQWRIAQLVMASFMLPVVIYVWWLLESARWLFNRGRTEEANELLLVAALVNKRSVPSHILEKVVAQKTRNAVTFKDLFVSPNLRKCLLILSFSWFSLSLAYNCLSFNVGNVGLSVFLMQLIFGLTDIPGQILCIWLLEAVGRKISCAFILIFGGCVCLLTLAFSEDAVIVVAVFVTIGRAFMNLAGTICVIYIQELFPTSLRYCQRAFGVAAIAGRSAPILSPMVNLLVTYHKAAPTLIYGSLPVLSGCLCLLLPETRRKDLPDTAEQLEERDTKDTEVPDASDRNVISSKL